MAKYQKLKQEPYSVITDVLHSISNRTCFFQPVNKKEIKSVLFSKGKIINRFFTEDSRLYITPKEQLMIENGIKLNRKINHWDGLSGRIVKKYQLRKSFGLKKGIEKDILFEKFGEYKQKIQENLSEKYERLWNRWTFVQIWNFSIIGAILLGMISMTLIYKLLGPGASATSYTQENEFSETAAQNIPSQSYVLGADSVKNDKSNGDYEGMEKIIEDLESSEKEEFEKKILSMVKGYPIEKMVPYIMKKDRIVAAFLIGIAKKESDWGKHVPVLEGQDCYNYWGYRGKRKLMGTGGHACFNGSRDAVDTVAKRIEWLVKNKKLDTPAKMVIWKCGSECYKDNQAAVRKWISDVNLYFEKLND